MAAAPHCSLPLANGLRNAARQASGVVSIDWTFATHRRLIWVQRKPAVFLSLVFLSFTSVHPHERLLLLRWLVVGSPSGCPMRGKRSKYSRVSPSAAAASTPGWVPAQPRQVLKGGLQRSHGKCSRVGPSAAAKMLICISCINSRRMPAGRVRSRGNCRGGSRTSGALPGSMPHATRQLHPCPPAQRREPFMRTQ